MSKICERIYTRGCERVRVHCVRRSRHANEIVWIRRQFIVISANSSKSLSLVEIYLSMFSDVNCCLIARDEFQET